MTAVPFDTLKLADRLQAGGFTQQQAHTMASALADATVGAEVATKADIAGLPTKAELQAGLAASKADLQAGLAETKADLLGRLASKADLAEAKAETLKWIIGAIGIQTVVILGAVIALVRAGH